MLVVDRARAAHAALQLSDSFATGDGRRVRLRTRGAKVALQEAMVRGGAMGTDVRDRWREEFSNQHPGLPKTSRGLAQFPTKKILAAQNRRGALKRLRVSAQLYAAIGHSNISLTTFHFLGSCLTTSHASLACPATPLLLPRFLPHVSSSPRVETKLVKFLEYGSRHRRVQEPSRYDNTPSRSCQHLATPGGSLEN